MMTTKTVVDWVHLSMPLLMQVTLPNSNIYMGNANVYDDLIPPSIDMDKHQEIRGLWLKPM